MIITTPLGDISFLLDNAEIDCTVSKLDSIDVLCPDVTARYKSEISFTPDKNNHTLSCCLTPTQKVDEGMESGERLECMAYYSEYEKIKLSIGLEAELSSYRIEYGYDYEAEFTVNNNVFYNSYLILPTTKTQKYVFGISWIENCNNENDFQTWYGADPSLM